MTEANDSSKASASLPVGISCWMTCSVGMLVFNKLAIKALPTECFLVALQMAAAVIFLLLFCRSSLHIGSREDVIRWMMVVPFFTGMLLTSILALKNAPMSLVVAFRGLSPLVSLAIERFYPNPISISSGMMASIAVMIFGVGLYSRDLSGSDYSGIGWVVLNNFFAIGDRLLQRLMLAKDQRPVDISISGITLLNNLLGMVPLLVVACLSHEVTKLPDAIASMDRWGILIVAASCVVGIGISYSGVWVQSKISATSFLVLVNANKFIIIFLEAFYLGTKVLTSRQIVGVSLAIMAGAAYGTFRGQMEKEAKGEKVPLLAAAEKK